MKTYNVKITGQQSHISGSLFENQTANQVDSIIESYWDSEYDRPQLDGNSWELNNDQYITIEDTSICEGSRVAKESGRNQYLTGVVIAVNGSKSLVNFDVRKISRWCNNSNLKIITS